MPSIHLIKNDPRLPQILPVQKGSDIFRSGYWDLGDEIARALIGGNIYFHEQQSKPSFFGGVVTETEKVSDGDYAGRIVFTFRFDPACKNVMTSRSGWSQEMKILL